MGGNCFIVQLQIGKEKKRKNRRKEERGNIIKD